MLFLLLFVLAVSSCQMTPALFPDTVYINGVVYTMDPDLPIAQGVALRDGKILAVGNDVELRTMVALDTDIIDLEGKVMVPGFYAAHDHFPGSGRVALFFVDLNSPPIGTINTMEELVEALRAKAATVPSGDWIEARGYDDTLIAEKRHPTRDDLDSASTEHPIFIRHISGHLAVANSMALELAGVTRDTPQPPGGLIRKDENGNPNGVFEESTNLVGRLIPPLTDDERLAAIEWAVEDYVEEGVTTTVIAGNGAAGIRDLQRAGKQGLLKLRVITMGSKGSVETSSPGEAGGFLSGFGDTRLKLGAVKVVQDGSIQGYTGYLSEPYHVPFAGDASYRGYPRRPREALTEMVSQLHRDGYQIAIHGNGDAAIDDILHAFTEAQRTFPRVDARHRIEHCQMARDDQLDQMKELGVSPSFFVGHAYYWGDRHRDIFMGPDRAARLSPLKSALERGIRFSVHDDTPVTPVRPLQLVWDAVNRRTTSEQVLGPEQRISVEEAFRAVTIDAAWQNHEDTIKGSIEAGKLADLVILEKDPFDVDPLLIKDIRVLETIVDGVPVYQR